MNRAAFWGLIRHDLLRLYPSVRFAVFLSVSLIAEVLWLLALAIFTPLAMSDPAVFSRPLPVFLFLLLPSLAGRLWHEETLGGSLALILSTPLSSPALAAARCVSLVLAGLPFALVPSIAVLSLCPVLGLEAGPFFLIQLSSLWLVCLAALFVSFTALFFHRGPFGSLVPLLTVLALLVVSRLMDAWSVAQPHTGASLSGNHLKALFAFFNPMMHWEEMLSLWFSFDSLLFLLLFALTAIFIEGRFIEGLRQRGEY